MGFSRVFIFIWILLNVAGWSRKVLPFPGKLPVPSRCRGDGDCTAAFECVQQEGKFQKLSLSVEPMPDASLTKRVSPPSSPTPCQPPGCAPLWLLHQERTEHGFHGLTILRFRLPHLVCV